MTKITEHSITINATLPKGDVHAKMPVFYNPLMVSNRNISILLINSIITTNLNIALPLAGSGIRGLRFLKELNQEKINHLWFNDKKDTFPDTIKNNLKQNKLKKTNISITTEDAPLFLLNQINSKKKPDHFCGYFDYIDLDPFGTPNPFLAAAVNRLPRKGILAITATDTAALTGTYAKVTKRKYWATPMRNYLMHEIGLRILIRKIQLLGVQFDKALTPILAYHKDHYFRIFLQQSKGKVKCDKILKQHQYLLLNSKTLEFKTSKFNQEKKFTEFAGPLWIGQLKDQKIINKMCKNNPFPEEQKFLNIIKQEKDIVGFYDLHALAKKYKKEPPKIDITLTKLNATRTHFSKTGVKTTKSIKDVIKLLKTTKNK